MSDDIKLPPLPTIDVMGKPCKQGWFTAQGVDALRRAAVEADRQGREEPAVWKPIETAPKDNKRLLYLARLDDQGKLVELDFDGVWEYWQESWELSHINGYCWMSANGIEEPTHWAYQDEPPPTPPQPAASAKPWKECRHCGWECRPNKSESGWKPLAAPVAQEPVAWFTEDHLTDKSATTWDATVAERWRAKGWPVDPLYAVPVAQEPPQVTDAEIEQIVTGAGARWDGSVWKVEDADLHPMARALLYRYTTAPVAAQLHVTDEMVTRFLGWHLPQDFAPDCGISFKPLGHPNGWPVGTNLFTDPQARAMLEYVLTGVQK